MVARERERERCHRKNEERPPTRSRQINIGRKREREERNFSLLLHKM
jgi:hypothetical protein